MTIIEFYDKVAIENIAGAMLCNADKIILVGDSKKKMERRNNKEVVNAVSPVLPPAEIPVPDSTKVVTVEVPSNAPVVVAMESASIILL